MKCYIHHDSEAVGLCKNCKKGICPECLTEVDNNGIVCKGNCAEVMKKKGKQVKTTKVVFVVSSLVLICLAAIDLHKGYERGSIIKMAGGVLYAVVGILGVFLSKNYNGNNR